MVLKFFFFLYLVLPRKRESLPEKVHERWRLKAGKAYSKMGIRTPVPQPTARLESSVLRGLERQPIHGDLDKNV